MKMRVTAFMLLAAMVTAMCGAAPAVADSVHYVSLETGHSTVVPAPGVRRVAVGDAAVAGVVVVAASQLLINGKAPGHTSVFVWCAGKRTTYEVTVSNQGTNALAQVLRSAIPFPDVQVVSFGKSLVVRGTVPDMAAFVELKDMIARFDTFDKEGKTAVLNAVQIAHSLQSIQRDFTGEPGISGLQIEPDGQGNVIVSGKVRDETQAVRVLQRAKALAGPYLAAKGDVINRLEESESTQIMVRVGVLEVDKTALKNLGVQLQSAVFNPDGTYTLGGPSYPVVEQTRPVGSAFSVGGFFRTITLAPTINALITEGHARILSAPDLVTQPGSAASFLVGGEIPYAYSTGLGQVSIAFKDYGVKLDVTPTIMPNGYVDSKIAPDISDLDYQNAVTLNGLFIPALKQSRISTEVITKPGQSIVLGGMLRRVESRTISKIPLLGDVPVFGQLFRSTRYQNDETDVVFVMTPEIHTQ
ncbi:MAG: pilus assembly protein N-terminal domain-containing protein [Candidatus Eremiobacteraeota bacterium]|nr:pilus assembly protein N-terminal domain-containing protein [Candidatus Eremiobacteraeota bacterium]